MIAFVGHHPDAAILGDGDDALHLAAIENRAAGVRRRVEDDHLGLRRDRTLDHGSGQREAFLLIGVDEHALAAGVVHHVLISDPVGHRDDDFVAGIDQRLRQIEDGVLAADGDDALLGVVGSAVVGLVAIANGLLQLFRATGIGVLGEVLIDGVDGGLLDVLGRRKIRLAGSEIDHVIAFAAQTVGVGRDFHGGRRADQRDSFG